MKEEILFAEQQSFKQIWLWALMLPINGLVLFGFISQVFFGKTFGDKPGSDFELGIALMTVSLVTLFLFFLRLETQIKKDGVYYRFFPFHRKYKKISWDRISKAYVRKYHPLAEYGGWGFRFGFGSGT